MIPLLTFAALGFGGPIAVRALAPAAETVSNRADLFPFERVQLTDVVVADVDVSQFSFARDGIRGPGEEKKKCKTYPGDKEWPTKTDWELFGELLGGDALIRTVPEAGICYSWNGTVVENSSDCEALTGAWGNSTLR